MSDPREEKLQKIIDDGRASVVKALKEIHDEFASRTDLMVKPEAVDFVIDGYGFHPIIQGIAHSMTSHSVGQMLERAGIPSAFAQKLINLGEPDLLKMNLKRLTDKLEGDGIMIRRVNYQNDGKLIKGWLSPSYKRMDASPIFEAFIDRSTKKGFVPYRGLNTDYRYQISMVFPRIFNPTPQEFMIFGMSLTSGDYGNQSLQIELLMLRIVCMNLAIGYDLFRRVHLGSRFHMQEGDVVQISEKTHQLDTQTIVSAIGDVVDSGEEHIKMLEHKVVKSAEEILSETGEKRVYEALRKRFRKEIADQVKTMYELPQEIELLPSGQNLWRMSNAISLVANGVERLDEKVDLEKEAMGILMN
jgi:hypothetical protein